MKKAARSRTSAYPHLFLVLIGILSIFFVKNVITGSNSLLTTSKAQTANNLYVDPLGLDSNTGTSPSVPLKTIQAALDKATAGTTIYLAPGTYRERLTTKTDGTQTAPITLKGPEHGKTKTSRYQAVLFGTGRIVNVNHSHYVFDGFTIDGQEALTNEQYPTNLADVRAFKDAVQDRAINTKLMYIGSADTTRDLTGIVIKNMFLHGAGGECIRLRNNAHHNEIVDSVIEWCGMYGPNDDISQYKYHNAEGVYIGTSPKSTDQPMAANDTSSFNTIKNNIIYTYGSECMEVKENAHDNLFETNDCGFNDEPYNFLGSNIELRGYNNQIIGNLISNSRSIGLKMKSDNTTYTQGGNISKQNAFSNISNESIRNDQVTAQGIFCENTFTGTILVGRSVGNPTAACPQPTPTPTNTPTPTKTPTPTPTRTPTPLPQTTTITRTITQSSDDAEENVPAGRMNLSSNILELTLNVDPQAIGLRFQNISIPRNATITNAYVEFVSNTVNSELTNLIVSGEKVANATTFTTVLRNITQRPKTTASVPWNGLPPWVSNTIGQTPNLSSVIQEVINQSTWQSGNAINILITGSGKRVAKSFEQNATKAPKLVITFLP